MDYSKAKNIIIALLLVANLALGSVYMNRLSAEREAREAAAASTRLYLQELGVELSAPIPADEPPMPVLYVSIEKDAGPQSFDGCDVVLSGMDEAYSAVPQRKGPGKAPIIGAGRALQRLMSWLEPEVLKSLEVTGIDRIFWVDRREITAEAAEDTAVPAWRVQTNRGVFYIEAYEN